MSQPVFYIARFHPTFFKYWWWTTDRNWSPKPEDARVYHSAIHAVKKANELAKSGKNSTFFNGDSGPCVIQPTAPMPSHRANTPSKEPT